MQVDTCGYTRAIPYEGMGVRSAGNGGLVRCVINDSGGLLAVGGTEPLAFSLPVGGAAGVEWKQFLDGCG